MRLTIAIAFLVCLPLGAAPQAGSAGGLPRERATIVVVDAEGRPWSGASIVCFHAGVRSYPRLEPRDAIEVTSDGEGKATVELLPGCDYHVWARYKQADGKWRLSQLVRAAGGGAIRLVESGPPREAVRVRVKGLDAWAEEAPLRCYVSSHFGWRQELKLIDGTVEVPPLPVPHLLLKVYSRSWLILGSHTVQLAADGWPQTAAAAATATFEVRAPMQLELRVKDDNGAPVVGARVLASDEQTYGLPVGRLVEVASTDGDGRARLRVAGTLDEAAGTFAIDSALRVQAADFATAALHGSTRPLGEYYTVEAGVLCRRVVLGPGFAIRGRLLAAEGTPAVGTALFVHGYIRIPSDERSVGALGPCPHLVLAPGRDGRFEIPCCEAESSWSLWAQLDDASHAALSKDGDRMLLRRVCLAANGKRKADVLDLGDIRLDQLQRFAFQVCDPGGAPSRCPSLLVQVGDLSPPTDLAPGWLVLDEVGRGTLLAARGALASAAAASDASFAWRQVAGQAPGEVIELGLPACVTIRGNVVDPSGRSLSGRRIQLSLEGDSGPRDRMFSQWLGDRWYRLVGRLAADELGGFCFEVVPGFRYSVGAWAQDGSYHRVVADATQGEVRDLRLVVATK
jgi:hypothetical protein